MTKLVENLRRLMKERGITANALSERSGLSRTAVGKILDGSAKNPRMDTLQALAKVLGTTVAELTGDEGLIPIRSARTLVRWIAAAGNWQDPDYADITESVEFDVPALHRDGRQRYLCRVRGDSMNRAGINDGDYLVCLAFEDTDGIMRTGQIVIVERTNDKGAIETTVKALRCGRDRYDLVPMSTDPRHKTITVLKNHSADDSAEAALGSKLTKQNMA